MLRASETINIQTFYKRPLFGVLHKCKGFFFSSLKCCYRCRHQLSTVYCFNRSFSTAPALASGATGKGVKVGKASEIGFISRCPDPPVPRLAGVMRGTAAERGARNGFASGLLLIPKPAGSDRKYRSTVKQFLTIWCCCFFKDRKNPQ